MAKPKMQTASAQDFKKRRQAHTTITLPNSGLDVVVKEVDVMDLLQAGGIPTHLSSYVWHDVTDLTSGKSPEKVAAMLNERTQTLGWVCCAMLVSPRCVMEDAGADEITPEDIPFPDREVLWTVACGHGRVTDLARFPDEPDARPDGAQDREDVRPEAVSGGGVGSEELGSVPVR